MSHSLIELVAVKLLDFGSNLFLGRRPLCRLSQMQACMRKIASCARVCGLCQLPVRVIDFAPEGTICIVDDVYNWSHGSVSAPKDIRVLSRRTSNADFFTGRSLWIYSRRQ